MNRMKLLCAFATLIVFAIGFSATDEYDKYYEVFVNNNKGTYVFTDENGVTFTLTFNSDMTMTADANGKTYYGKWGEGLDCVNFQFSGSDSSDYPKIAFKADKYLYIDNDYYITDGFLYGRYHDIKSRDPAYRLKIKKIRDNGEGKELK